MMQIIAWVGFSQSLFAAVLMLTKTDRSVADKILTGWLSLLAIEFLTTGIDYDAFGAPLLSSAFLLFNPAFFLYIRSLTNPGFNLRWIHLLHLLPFFCFEIAAYILQEPYTLKNFFDTDSTLWFRYAFIIASLTSCFIYNAFSIGMVHRHRIKLKDEFSTIDRQKKLGWLMFIIVLYNIYCLFAIWIGILVILFSRHFEIQYQYQYSAMLATAYILGIYGIRQRMIYMRIYPESQPEADPPVNRRGLSSARKKQILDQLLQHFRKDKPYLNPDLSMQMLSEHLKIPKHHITEVLNQDLGRNFFQFVNEYRVNAVKEMLSKKYQPWSVEAIGYECGFNSKSTFFAVFKDITGMTPMQFRNQ
ncbi:MAG: helix-turn-helix transcriptional regulator [Bacteroidales bacterium]